MSTDAASFDGPPKPYPPEPTADPNAAPTWDDYEELQRPDGRPKGNHSSGNIFRLIRDQILRKIGRAHV